MINGDNHAAWKPPSNTIKDWEKFGHITNKCQITHIITFVPTLISFALTPE